MEISAVVLTKNSAVTLAKCLRSLEFADEVIVIDDYSTDKTLTIAKKFRAKIYKRELNSNWADQRNFALSKAKKGWVLFVDSDEYVSTTLAKEIKEATEDNTFQGFEFRRLDEFCGQVLKHGETGQIRLLRLGRKNSGKWTRAVHEVWEFRGKIGPLKNPLIHKRNFSVTDFIDRINTYTDIDAKEQIREGKVFSALDLFKPLGKFVQNFIFRQGFRDGKAGLFFAFLMSFYSLVLRIKVWKGKSVSPLSKFERILIAIVLVGTVINFIPVLGPELGFDALWYHLTLPKLWLWTGRWYFEGNLLFYSAMPRLTGIIFTPFLALMGTAGPKLVQYLSGLGAAWLTFKLAREFYRREISLLAAAMFYCTWLVGWESGSAYVDLVRTFLEMLGLLFVARKKYLSAGVMFGLAVGTKWQALISVFMAGVLFSPLIIPMALVVAGPWFYLSYRYTDSVVYPLLESWLKEAQLAAVGKDYLSITSTLKRIILIPYYLIKPFDDQLNPLFGFLVLPALASVDPKKKTQLKFALYLVGGLIAWQLLAPPSSRYFLPYLPLLAIFSAAIVAKSKLLKVVTVLSLVTIVGLRLAANWKYWGMILGQETTNQFLTRHAARLPETFIDSDNWVTENVPKGSRVLVDKLHNLYYMPINFDHISWTDDVASYDYLITTDIPKENFWNLVHRNSLGIMIYQKKPL